MRHAHRLSLSRYRVDAFEKIVYFGDGPWDAEACKELAWDFVGIATHMSGDELREMGAKAVFSDYSQPEDVRTGILA